jgi:hypothetical protein
MAEDQTQLLASGMQALRTGNSKGLDMASQLLAIPDLDRRLVNLLMFNAVSGFGVCKNEEEIFRYLEILWILGDRYSSIIDEKILPVLLHALITHSYLQKPSARIRIQILQTLYEKLNKEMFESLLPGLLRFLSDNLAAFCGQNLKSTLFEAVASLEILSKIVRDMFTFEKFEKYSTENKLRIQKVIRFNITNLITLTDEGSELDKRLCKAGLSYIEILMKYSHLIESYEEVSIKLLVRLQSRGEYDAIYIDSKYKDHIIKLARTGMNEMMMSIENGIGKYDIVYLNIMLQYLDTHLTYFLTCYTDLIIGLISRLTEVYIPAVVENKFQWKGYMKYIKSNELYEDLKEFLNTVVNYNILEELQTQWISSISSFNSSPSYNSALKILQLFISLQDIDYPEYYDSIYDTLSFPSFPRESLKDTSSLRFVINSLRVKELEFDIQTSEIHNPASLITKITQLYQEGFKGDVTYLLQILNDRLDYTSISAMITQNESYIEIYIKDSMKLYDLESVAPCIYHLLDSNSLKILPDIIPTSFNKLDFYVKRFDMKQIILYCKFYRSLANYLSQAFSRKILTHAYIIRKILLRFKPFLCYTRQANKSRRLAQEVLNLFLDYIPILSNTGIEYDPSDKSTFSYEEESNATIPKALPAISYEFLPSWVFCLKTAVSNSSDEVISLLCNLILSISSYEPEFWATSSRFESQIYSLLKIYASSSRKDDKFLKTALLISSLISSLPTSCTKNILQDWNKCNILINP